LNVTYEFFSRVNGIVKRYLGISISYEVVGEGEV
jgi:hypothetical protein